MRKTAYKNTPMAEVQTLNTAGTRKLPPDGKVRGTVLFFRRQLFYHAPPLLLSKLWPVRLISTRNSPQSRTFSCPMGIDPGGVVNLSWSQIHFMSFIPVTVLSDGGEFNKSKVK